MIRTTFWCRSQMLLEPWTPCSTQVTSCSKTNPLPTDLKANRSGPQIAIQPAVTAKHWRLTCVQPMPMV